MQFGTPQFPLDRLEARLVAQAIKERVGLGDCGFGRELSGFVWDIARQVKPAVS